MRRSLMMLLGVLWASTWSLLGALIGFLGVLTGGQVRRRGWTLEFHGGGTTWLLNRLPATPMAMTLGHTILGLSGAALDITRRHELVHVRQYALWGPFLIPAYLGCSLYLLLRGRDCYRDNPFERQAYREAG